MTQAHPPQVRAIDDISVVIPTIGRVALKDCIESIAAGQSQPAHLIVVDQSYDGQVSALLDTFMARGVKIEHIRSSQRGAGAARNRGMEIVQTPFIAATDDDCLVDENWLQRLSARLHEHPDRIITGQVRPDGDGEAVSTITSNTRVTHSKPILNRDPLFSANMGLAKAVMDRIGPFSEDKRLAFAEDAEWSYRALKIGVPIEYAPEIVVTHTGWRNEAERREQYKRYARSQGAFYGIYLRRGDTFIARRAVYDLLRGPWMLVKGLVTSNADLTSIGQAYLTQLPIGLLSGCQRPQTS